jgi:hypothetical protein
MTIHSAQVTVLTPHPLEHVPTYLQCMAASEYSICLLQGMSYVYSESQDEHE